MLFAVRAFILFLFSFGSSVDGRPMDRRDIFEDTRLNDVFETYGRIVDVLGAQVEMRGMRIFAVGVIVTVNVQSERECDRFVRKKDFVGDEDRSFVYLIEEVVIFVFIILRLNSSFACVAPSNIWSAKH